jgi:Tfp pilus assembly protein PilX
MKQVLIVLAMAGACSSFADDQVVVNSGDTVVVDTGIRTQVTCRPGSVAKPNCTLKASSLPGYENVMLGDQPMGQMLNLDDAVAQVKKLRDAGLCN